MDQNPTMLRRRLGDELRTLRRRSGLSLEGASQALRDQDHDISDSKLSRLENGRGAIRLQDMRGLLALYETSDAEGELLMQMAREAKAAAQSAWWTDYESVLPGGFETYVGLESAASRVLAFTLTTVDGLLQTEDYARALIRASQVTEPHDTIDRLVKLRLQRQDVLTHEPCLELVTIMDEAALRRPVGGPAVMRDQLRHLLEITETRPNVTIQVIPLSKGAYGAMHGTFRLVEPRDLAANPVGYVDSMGGNLYLQRTDQIRRLQTTFGRLQAFALDPDDSLRVVRTAAEEM